ncbi:hypothetical protein AVEN_81794-1 [Araneus ventricosus]|uniref:Uncharacterized protein n=1 Tax=Araneus ventricosus TaxID=182803 RepID=A0A4Y2L8L6_ARAVE|nr:hypothetical protein AVEN_81794-1 [Araneus ventricosus]
MLLDSQCVPQCGPTTLRSISIRRLRLQKTCFRLYNTCRRAFSSSFGPKEKKHCYAAARYKPLCKIREKNLLFYGAKTHSQCRSLCKATSCVCPPQRTTEKGHLMLGKKTRFLDQTAMGFCTLHRRVQIHTGERFRASTDLEGTTYQIPSIQHS